MALSVPEMFSWPARTRSICEIFGCVHVFDLVLLYVSKLNEGSCLQLLFYFIVLINVVASFIGMNFFRCFRFYFDIFSSCTLTKTFALGFQKWFDNDWVIFGVFWRIIPQFVDTISAWSECCMNCSFVYLFWRHQISSTVSSVVFLVCSVTMFILFNNRFL